MPSSLATVCNSLLILYLVGASSGLIAQEERLDKQLEDEAYIARIEDSQEPDKVLHAEPLYIDLIRDLGARKGEREWNLGFGILDYDSFDEYEALIEYEFAPFDRLGLEIELPFSFFSLNEEGAIRPDNQLNSLQLAAQYTFLVSQKAATSLAIGYLHEFELVAFDDYGDEDLYKGNVFNPFFVAAKRWGDHFHTLIYTGPEFEHHFGSGNTETTWAINTNFHYMIPGTSNFVGLELNKIIEDGDFDMVLRPQMRLEISGALMAGIVAGIPVAAEDQGMSMFLRLIYEPLEKDH